MMDQKISTINESPVRKGLVQPAEDWPYSSFAYRQGALVAVGMKFLTQSPGWFVVYVDPATTLTNNSRPVYPP